MAGPIRQCDSGAVDHGSHAFPFASRTLVERGFVS